MQLLGNYRDKLFGNFAVFCFLCTICFKLLAQEIISVITCSPEELLDIRAAVTHQNYLHYDQEYCFPGADPLVTIPRAI
jgi:hypothetical protein